MNENSDLPPISSLKNALARRHIAAGIPYSLPVDHGRHSSQTHYRTDLRAVFQYPYFDKAHDFNEELLLSSKKHHLQTNVPFKLFRKTGRRGSLDMKSDEAFKSYRSLSPRVSRDKRKRSVLYLPLKQSSLKESESLKKKALEIIKSIEIEKLQISPPGTALLDRRNLDDLDYEGKNKKRERYLINDLKRASTCPDFNKIPDEIKSRENSDQIWKWLRSSARVQSPLTFFLDSVCNLNDS